MIFHDNVRQMTDNPVREKFATQMDTALLAEVRALARDEGRQLQAVIEEAVRDLLIARKGGDVRKRVADAYRHSVERFAPLYERLAK